MPSEDLGDAIRSIGYNPSEVDAMEIVNKYDVNADGLIDKSEWKEICFGLDQSLDYDARLVTEINSNFAILAKGNTSISTTELAYVACNLGDALTPDQAKEMIAVVDANGDGKVDAGEFMLMRGAPLAHFEPDW
jgi:Ca2+-binding EF-hand superfamily protein